MRRRIGRLGFLVAAVVAALASAPDAARAYHDDETEIVVDTAHTLDRGEVRLGLWRLDWGVLDAVDLGTYTLVWAVPLPNAQIELRPWRDGRWALSFRTGLYYTDSDWLYWLDTDSTFSAGIWPFELYFTAPLSRRWALTFLSAWTTVFLQGTYDPDEFLGAAAVDNLQLGLSVEWRASRVVALVLSLRWLAFERARGDARFVSHPDELTTIEIVGAASLQGESVRNAAHLMLSSVLSWESFNLRIGVGAGNYNVPSLNLMLPDKSLIGELDLYFRF